MTMMHEILLTTLEATREQTIEIAVDFGGGAGKVLLALTRRINDPRDTLPVDVEIRGTLAISIDD